MSYTLYRHPEVERDLFDIAQLIADFAGNSVAERKLDEIEQAVNRLADNPHIGSIRNAIHPGLRAIPVARKGVITFTVDDEAQAVLIVSITYAGADWIGRMPLRTEK